MVKNIVEKEIKQNESKFKQYMKLTRPPDKTIKSVKLFLDSIDASERRLTT